MIVRVALPCAVALIAEVACQPRVLNCQRSVGRVRSNNRVQRVDVADSALEKAALVSAGQELQAVGTADIWLLAPAEKLKPLHDLIGREPCRMVPKLVKP